MFYCGYFIFFSIVLLSSNVVSVFYFLFYCVFVVIAFSFLLCSIVLWLLYFFSFLLCSNVFDSGYSIFFYFVLLCSILVTVFSFILYCVYYILFFQCVTHNLSTTCWKLTENLWKKHHNFIWKWINLACLVNLLNMQNYLALILYLFFNQFYPVMSNRFCKTF